MRSARYRQGENEDTVPPELAGMDQALYVTCKRNEGYLSPLEPGRAGPIESYPTWTLASKACCGS